MPNGISSPVLKLDTKATTPTTNRNKQKTMSNGHIGCMTAGISKISALFSLFLTYFRYFQLKSTPHFVRNS